MAIVNHTPAYDLALAQKLKEIQDKARIREDYDLQRAEADRFNRENLELRKVIQDLRAENTALSTRVANDGIRMRELTAKHERLIATARAVDDVATRYGSNDMSVDLFDVQASINELRAAVGDAPDAVLPRIEARAAPTRPLAISCLSSTKTDVREKGLTGLTEYFACVNSRQRRV